MSNEWKPIETAPKDGRDIWLFVPKEVPGQLVGYWSADDGGFWQYREQLVADVAGWIDGATHWMPLPSPPHQKEQGGGGDGDGVVEVPKNG